jgi:hypothetical protein
MLYHFVLSELPEYIALSLSIYIFQEVDKPVLEHAAPKAIPSPLGSTSIIYCALDINVDAEVVPYESIIVTLISYCVSAFRAADPFLNAGVVIVLFVKLLAVYTVFHEVAPTALHCTIILDGVIAEPDIVPLFQTNVTTPYVPSSASAPEEFVRFADNFDIVDGTYVAFQTA